MADKPPEGFRQYRYETPPGATTVLLVRHGESIPSHPERPFPLLDGHGDPPLDPAGRAQARLLADRLAGEHERETRIDAVYVTTLCRTHQTAAPLAARLGLSPKVEPDLREVHLGDWEGGLLRVKVAAGDPLVARIFSEERWDVIPGAEPLDVFDRRIGAGLARIVSAHPDQRVVAVVHGGVIGQLLHRVTAARRFAFAGADNASISEIVVSGERVWLRRFNDTSHLDGAGT